MPKEESKLDYIGTEETKECVGLIHALAKYDMFYDAYETLQTDVKKSIKKYCKEKDIDQKSRLTITNQLKTIEKELLKSPDQTPNTERIRSCIDKIKEILSKND